jgi:hypothetical protein
MQPKRQQVKRKRLKTQFVSCCLLLRFITRCSGVLGRRHSEEATDFPREVSRLEKRARYHPEVSVRARSHLELAFLYLDRENPQLDYARALREMTEYVSLNPTGTTDKRVLDWLAALKEMHRIRQEGMESRKANQALKARTEKLQASMEKALELNKTLREETSGLKEANRNLNEAKHGLKDGNQNLKGASQKLLETIESLKALDAQMEEKRNQIK